jgi:hypothetical protein
MWSLAARFFSRTLEAPPKIGSEIMCDMAVWRFVSIRRYAISDAGLFWWASINWAKGAAAPPVLSSKPSGTLPRRFCFFREFHRAMAGCQEWRQSS